MKRVIYSLFSKIKHHKITSVGNTDSLFDEYYDRLLDNKVEYAKSIGVDFKMYTDFKSNGDDDYININHYKHELMAELAEIYDEVMYVDFDVVFNTSLNVFKELDLSAGIAIKDQNEEINHKLELELLHKRNPTLKYLITKQLLGGQENDVINTGLMIGKAHHIKQIKYKERLPALVKKISKLKCLYSDLMYPNNEALFSYIVKQYNVPYQIVDPVWHDIRDYRLRDNCLGNIVHFINKNFDTFFKDKTKCVFSLYINIPDKKLDNPGNYHKDTINKSARTKSQMNLYYDQLLDNKRNYSEAIGADFKMFDYSDDYILFAEKYPLLSMYDVINLYKIYLLDELSKKYDYVLYLDFDVVADQNVNFFDYNNVTDAICCQWGDVSERKAWAPSSHRIDYRSPISKYWNTEALLAEEDIYDIPPIVFNTGIVGVSSNVMKQLDYFGDMDEVINTMTELKNDPDSMYLGNIQKSFGYDNETIFMYKAIKNKVNYNTLDEKWHYKILPEYEQEGKDYKKDNAVLLHFIGKKFELIFN
jgi:hypothetical protein